MYVFSFRYQEVVMSAAQVVTVSDIMRKHLSLVLPETVMSVVDRHRWNSFVTKTSTRRNTSITRGGYLID